VECSPAIFLIKKLCFVVVAKGRQVNKQTHASSFQFGPHFLRNDHQLLKLQVYFLGAKTSNDRSLFLRMLFYSHFYFVLITLAIEPQT
jgi:hypothetical protein